MRGWARVTRQGLQELLHDLLLLQSTINVAGEGEEPGVWARTWLRCSSAVSFDGSHAVLMAAMQCFGATQPSFDACVGTCAASALQSQGPPRLRLEVIHCLGLCHSEWQLP